MAIIFKRCNKRMGRNWKLIEAIGIHLMFKLSANRLKIKEATSLDEPI